MKWINKKAEGLTQGAIRAMFDFVSKEIRYTGVTNENTAPGYEPHDVKDTFVAKSRAKMFRRPSFLTKNKSNKTNIFLAKKFKM